MHKALTARQSAAARGWLGWSQADLCKRSGIYRQKIIECEKGNPIDPDSQDRLTQTFLDAGIVLQPDGSISLEP